MIKEELIFPFRITHPPSRPCGHNNYLPETWRFSVAQVKAIRTESLHSEVLNAVVSGWCLVGGPLKSAYWLGDSCVPPASVSPLICYTASDTEG